MYSSHFRPVVLTPDVALDPFGASKQQANSMTGRAVFQTEWRDCPVCGQSATGVYAGRCGCSRCGWPMPPKRAGF